MDAATALWIVLPLAAVHVVVRRSRAALLFQVAVDVILLLLPGRLLLRGLHIGPGAPGAPEWGGGVTVTGSPEQSDLPLQFEPWWAEVSRLGAAGEPPWISDRIGGGAPLFANGQTGLPFPLHLPVWVLGPERGNDVMSVWKLELAALGGFLLLRRLGLQPIAAAAGALPYGFGLYHLSWLVQGMAWVVALAPWALWALIATLRGNRRSAAGLAVLLGALAGWSVHPETATFLWLALAVVGTAQAWGRGRRLRRLATPFLLAVPVAAVGAIPLIATIADTAKLAESRGAAMYPDPALSWSFRMRMAALILMPWREGDPAAGTWRQPFSHAAVSVSIGAAPLALLLLGGVRRRHRRIATGLAAVGLCSVGLVYQLPVFAHVVGHLPVLERMTWVRAGFLIGLAAAYLGALAFDAWLRRPSRGRLVAAGLVVGGAVVGLHLGVHGGELRGLLVAAGAPAAVATVAAVGVGPWAVPALIAVETLANDWRLLGGSRDQASPPAIVEVLQRLVAGGGGRVLGLGDALPPNLPARYGLADLRSSDPVRPLGLAHLHQALGAVGMALPGPVTMPWAGLAGAWGVRWLATPPQGVTGPAAAGWEEAYQDAGGRVYRNPRALPVLRLASAAASPPGDPARGEWETVDFATTAVTTERVALGGSGTIRVVEERPYRWVAEVESHGVVLAILHTPRAPGWRVWLDGSGTRVVEANLGALGVVVPTGHHEVRWEYAPVGLWPGLALTVAGLAGCLVLALGAWPGNRAARQPSRYGPLALKRRS
ncbi:MAG: hypothetical protein ACHQQS_11475 [Thermoanaerobaculales bacterium]